MAGLLKRIGEVAIFLLKNGVLARRMCVGFGVNTKPLPHAFNESDRHIMALAAVVHERNRMLWNRSNLLYAAPVQIYAQRIFTTKPSSSVASSIKRKQVEKVMHVMSSFGRYRSGIIPRLREMYKQRVFDVPNVKFYIRRLQEKMRPSKKDS